MLLLSVAFVRARHQFFLPPCRPSSASLSGLAWKKQRPRSTAAAWQGRPALVRARHQACLCFFAALSGLRLMGYSLHKNYVLIPESLFDVFGPLYGRGQ